MLPASKGDEIKGKGMRCRRFRAVTFDSRGQGKKVREAYETYFINPMYS